MQRPEPTLRLLAAGSSSWRAGAGVGCVCADTRAVGYWTRWGTRVWLAILEPCLEGKSDGDGYVLASPPLIVALIVWRLCGGSLQFTLKALYNLKQVGMLLPVRDARASFVDRTDSHRCRIGSLWRFAVWT
jgi:hypothetical protein